MEEIRVAAQSKLDEELKLAHRYGSRKVLQCKDYYKAQNSSLKKELNAKEGELEEAKRELHQLRRENEIKEDIAEENKTLICQNIALTDHLKIGLPLELPSTSNIQLLG